MSDEFNPIETQEQLDEIIKSRLERERKKYEGYASPEDIEKMRADQQSELDRLTSAQKDIEKKYAEREKTLKDYEAKIAGYESDSVKTKIAAEVGLPLELRDRLRGETEDEIREDARLLLKLTEREAPQYSPEAMMTQEDLEKSKKQKALNKMVKNLT